MLDEGALSKASGRHNELQSLLSYVPMEWTYIQFVPGTSFHFPDLNKCLTRLQELISSATLQAFHTTSKECLTTAVSENLHFVHFKYPLSRLKRHSAADCLHGSYVRTDTS